MAKQYFGLNRGQTEFDITQDSSTVSKDVELVIDLSKSLTKSEVLIKLEELENAILKNQWPPA